MDDEIKNTVNGALKKYYLSLGYVPIALSNILRKNGFGELKIMMRSMTAFIRYLR